MNGRGLFGSSRNAFAALVQPQFAPPAFNALAALAPQQAEQRKPQAEPDYGKRQDGTAKGRGYLGEIKTPDGRVMTEYSIGVDWGEGEQEIPTIVPTLTQQEIDYLSRGGEPTPQIIDKAIEHARKRIRMGFSPFAMRGIDY